MRMSANSILLSLNLVAFALFSAPTDRSGTSNTLGALPTETRVGSASTASVRRSPGDQTLTVNTVEGLLQGQLKTVGRVRILARNRIRAAHVDVRDLILLRPIPEPPRNDP